MLTNALIFFLEMIMTFYSSQDLLGVPDQITSAATKRRDPATLKSYVKVDDVTLCVGHLLDY